MTRGRARGVPRKAPPAPARLVSRTTGVRVPRITGFPTIDIAGPTPAPFVGHLPAFFRFMDDPVGGVRRLRPYGDVVGVVRGSPALVCAFGPDRNREVLGNPTAFPHGEELVPTQPGTPLGRLSQLMVTINGDLHRRHRKLVLPAFSRVALDGYAVDVLRVTQGVVARWPRDTVVDLEALTRDLALCVAVQCLFGLDVLAGATGLGELANRFIDTFASPLTIALPYDLPGLSYRTASRLGAELIGTMEALIARRRAEPGGTDALSLLVRARDDEGETLSDDELIAETATLYIAGHETTARTLLWTLFLLERHPTVLADVLDELDAVGHPVGLADLPALPLLDRVVKESMRVLTPVPITFMRVPGAETELGGVRLPKDANVVVSPFATHHDPALFPDPERFLPARWETIKPGHFEYLPFGAGPRICVGASFAQMSIRLMLPTILQAVRPTLVAGQEVSRKTRANILGSRHGVKVRLLPPGRDGGPAPIGGDIRELVTLDG